MEVGYYGVCMMGYCGTSMMGNTVEYEEWVTLVNEDVSTNLL